MATPASSATSPSPPISFRPHPPQSLPPTAASTDPSEKEQRKKAVQKFLARAEISMVTRALRARLSYASYKAAHNIPHLSLRDLEERTLSQPQPPSLPRSIAAKRKVAAMNKESTTSAAISPAGLSSMITSAHIRGGSDSMAPPTTVSTTRNNAYPQTSGNTSAESGPSPRSGNSLYSSILAPPPIKQARTIHHANELSISSTSTAPTPSPRTRVTKPSSGRGRGRAKAAERPLKPGESPGRRRKTSSIDKGKQKQALTDAEMNVDTDGDVAMKAAATLTSWLLHSRQPTVAASPRSSFDGSETSSTYSHFAQSSARTTTTTAAVASEATSPAGASVTSTTEPPALSRTPSPAGRAPEHATPRAPTGDEEAADLMLLFAASPSPARPPGSKDKDTRDMAAFRALSGGSNALLSKGRVLFPSSGDLPGAEDASPGGTARQPQYRHQHTRSGPPLMRGNDSSFSSSMSSISSQLGRRGSADAGRLGSLSQLGPPSKLLPPPTLPAREPSATGRTTPEHAVGRASSTISSPKSSGGQTSDFNFSDFINASPSPARPGAGQILSLGQGLTPSAQKPNLGLRADVGRKLFEEEQMRNATSAGVPKSPHARGLSASIDSGAMRS